MRFVTFGLSLIFLCCFQSEVALAQGSSEKPYADSRFREEPILLGAHRGGRDLWPENTLTAFKKCAAQYPDALLEGDVYLSKDGHVVMIHDKTVDRTTNGSGAVAEMTLEELQALDAGYKFTPDGGKTFPYRGKGVKIPTFKEVLEALPDRLFLIELKDGNGIAEAMVKVIRETKAEDRVLLASMNPIYMHAVRKQAPEIATCFDVTEAMRLFAMVRSDMWGDYDPPALMLTSTPGLIDRFGVTPKEIKKIQEKGILYQLFTLNTKATLNAALDRGVDSILTDKPDLLAEILAERKADN